MKPPLGLNQQINCLVCSCFCQLWNILSVFPSPWWKRKGIPQRSRVVSERWLPVSSHGIIRLNRAAAADQRPGSVLHVRLKPKGGCYFLFNVIHEVTFPIEQIYKPFTCVCVCADILCTDDVSPGYTVEYKCCCLGNILAFRDSFRCLVTFWQSFINIKLCS